MSRTMLYFMVWEVEEESALSNFYILPYTLLNNYKIFSKSLKASCRRRFGIFLYASSSLDNNLVSPQLRLCHLSDDEIILLFVQISQVLLCFSFVFVANKVTNYSYLGNVTFQL